MNHFHKFKSIYIIITSIIIIVSCAYFKSFKEGLTNSNNIILIGDSILNNSNYVSSGKSVADILKTKTQKVFNPATLTKPGFFTNVFFGGIPRLFRSPSQRRLRILMQSTKWWLGFLDYVGLGNWVGAEELSKKMGDENFMKKVDEYNQTPEAKQNFEDQFGSERVEGQTNNQQSTSSSTSSEPNLDPLAKFLRGLFTGQMNPIPGM